MVMFTKELNWQPFIFLVAECPFWVIVNPFQTYDKPKNRKGVSSVFYHILLVSKFEVYLLSLYSTRLFLSFALAIKPNANEMYM